LWISSAVVVFYIIVTVMVFAENRRLSKLVLKRIDCEKIPEDANRWAVDNGFEFVGCYTVQLTSSHCTIWSWQRTDRSTFFCTYYRRSKDIAMVTYDLFTLFAQGISLTTSNSKDGQGSPRKPGAYMQTFSKLDFDGRWHEHIESENYLMDSGQAQLEINENDFVKSFEKEIHEYAQYTRTTPLWPLLWPYWYFIHKNLRHGKSICIQHEKGMIKLPNELTEQEREFIESLKANDQQEHDFGQRT